MGNKNCKHCQTLIPAKAKVCPNCKKSQGMSLGLKIIIGIVIFIVLIGMFGGTDEPTSTESKNDKNNQEEAKKTFEQNETVEYKGVKYTVVKVEKSNGKQYNEPKDGYEFIEVTIKIENTSEEKYSYNSYYWKMENSQGQELDESMLYLNEYDDALGTGDLKKGGVVTGKLGFEQPKDDKKLYLNFYDNIFDEDYSFQIKIN